MDKTNNIKIVKRADDTYDINWELNTWVTLAGLLVVSSLLSMDILADYIGWHTPSHLITEFLSVLCLIALMIYLLIMSLRARIAARVLESRASGAEEEALKWEEKYRELLKGLGHAIDQQFEQWGLTTAEKEIGLLILKGMSFKEMAELRSVSERTIRQQATLLYKKTATGNRSEFAAFFLEDLLLPFDE